MQPQEQFPLSDELRRIRVLKEQNDILVKELKEGHRESLKAFHYYLVQSGLAEEGYNPDILVDDFIGRYVR